jgi:hypothetical protein
VGGHLECRALKAQPKIYPPAAQVRPPIGANSARISAACGVGWAHLSAEREGRGLQRRRSSRAGGQRLVVENSGQTWCLKKMQGNHRHIVAILMGGLRPVPRPCGGAARGRQTRRQARSFAAVRILQAGTHFKMSTNSVVFTVTLGVPTPPNTQ